MPWMARRRQHSSNTTSSAGAQVLEKSLTPVLPVLCCLSVPSVGIWHH